MKNWKLIPFFVCLTLFLSVTAFADDEVSVTLLFPDGTWSQETVSCPEDASLWYASYSESGKTLETGLASVQNARAVVSLSQEADSVRAFALGGNLQPLAPAALVKAPSFLQRGIAKYLDGDYAGAIADFTFAIQTDEDPISSHIWRGDAYIASGETAKNLAAAQADYKAALALDETIPEAYLGLADAFIRRAEYDEAIEILLKGKNKAPDMEAIEWKLDELDSGTVWDLSGNIRRESGYNDDGALVWIHEYSYDAQGRPSAVAAYDADGNQIGRVDLEYDANDNPLVGYLSSDEDGLLFRVTYEYDRDGNLTQMREYDPEGRLTQRVLSQYDKWGLETRTDFHSRNDETGEMEWSSYTLWQYDESGILTRREEYSPEDVLQSYQTWTYNDDGQIKESRQYSTESGDVKLTWRQTYEYNGRGDCVMETDYDENGIVWIIMNQYDEYGNYTGSIHYDGNGNIIGYQ